MLLQYRRFAVPYDWDAIRTTVFAGRDAPSLTAIRAMVQHDVKGHVQDLVFVLGRKVTGDQHVPLGADTWGALVYPTMDVPEAERFPKVMNRETNIEETVVRRWYGWGTLAYPGFNRPSWSPGQLVEVRADDIGARFGFCWNRSGRGAESTILNWLPAQVRVRDATRRAF